MNSTIAWSQIEGPVGPLVFAATQQGLCYISFQQDQNKEETTERLKWKFSKWFRNVKMEENNRFLSPFMQQVEEYFNQDRTTFDMPLDLYGTEFQKKVWQALQKIPFGKCCSYKDIAESIGNKRAVRAVGGANNKNPIVIVIPCHRVIGIDGSLTGYGGGLNKKRYLLNHEGWIGA